jgi:hypothetical protein
MTASSIEYQVFDDQTIFFIDLEKRDYSCGEWRMQTFIIGMWSLVCIMVLEVQMVFKWV